MSVIKFLDIRYALKKIDSKNMTNINYTQTATHKEKFINKKILLKISGEFLGSTKENFPNMKIVINFIQTLIQHQNKVCLVVGGGNIIRGNDIQDNENTLYDQMGMLATNINGLAIRANLPNSTCLSSFSISGICEQYSIQNAMRMFDQGKALIFTGGIGCPKFSTDTAAVLRAVEMKCDFVLKATKVPGVYDKDPAKYSNAAFHSHLSYEEVIQKNLGVMDLTSIILARENNMKICVFSLENINFENFIQGKEQCSIIQK